MGVSVTTISVTSDSCQQTITVVFNLSPGTTAVVHTHGSISMVNQRTTYIDRRVCGPHSGIVYQSTTSDTLRAHAVCFHLRIADLLLEDPPQALPLSLPEQGHILAGSPRSGCLSSRPRSRARPNRDATIRALGKVVTAAAGTPDAAVPLGRELERVE